MSRPWISAWQSLFGGRFRLRASDVGPCLDPRARTPEALKLRRAALALSLVSTVIAAGPLAAADRYPFWARNFTYLPTFSATSGAAPLQTTAQWTSSFAVLADASRWSDYPWYEHITLDWGDGTLVRVPTSTMAPVAGAPANLARKTWFAQSLTHTYDAQGSYTVRLIYEKPGIVDADVLTTVSVSTPPPPPAPAVVAAINAGGPAFPAADGTAYAADQLFAGSSKTNAIGARAIAGTTNDKLYRTERIGTGAVFGYNLPVADGTYDVTMRFAETLYDRRLWRIFDVALEDRIVLDNLDLFAAAGGKNTAYDVTRRVSVSDGNLDIDFIKVLRSPKINAILVRAADTVTAASFSSDAGFAASAHSVAPLAASSAPAAGGSADKNAGAENARDDEPGCPERRRACPATRVYEISYMAFIPANHVRLDAPAATCRDRDGTLAPLVFSGDDRGFDADAHLRKRYRVLQRALVVERTGADGQSSLDLALSESLVRPDLAFRAGRGPGSAFRHGDRLSADDEASDQHMGDCKLLHARATDDQRGWQDPYVVSRSAHGLKLSFRGVLRHGLLPDPIPEIAWDFAVNVDASTTSLRISARGWHTGFPAHELYVDDQPLVLYSPLRAKKLPALGLNLSHAQWRKLPLQPLRASVHLRN